MTAAGRDVTELEMVGGIRGTFTDPSLPADLGLALESVPAQLERGFTSICFKPSQFVDDGRDVGPLCREIVRRVEEIGR
jgi:hypothetical protein